MKYELKTIELSQRINIRYMLDDKFTVGRISITMLLPLQKETVASNAILPFVLKRSTKNNPSFIELNRKLSMLYGASISTDVKKIGDCQALTLSIAGLDDKYTIDDTKITKEITDLLLEVLFNPNLIDNKFSKDDIEQEKRELIDILDSEINDKRVYAKNRMIELMCKDEPFGLNSLGSKSLIQSVTNEELVSSWERIKNESKIEVFILGLSNPDEAIKAIEKSFLKYTSDNKITLDNTVIKQSKKVNYYKDEFKVAQSKLVMGFRTGVANPDKDVVNTTLMTVIFGGSPSSKLFMNVREKLSLCYYCSANYNKNKGIIVVQSGVEHKNIEKAKTEILNQLHDIQVGNITEEEINAAKLSITNMLNTISDGITSLENYYVLQMFDNKVISPSEYAGLINTVTKEQIIEASKKVTLDTVYVLTDKNEGGNN